MHMRPSPRLCFSKTFESVVIIASVVKTKRYDEGLGYGHAPCRVRVITMHFRLSSNILTLNRHYCVSVAFTIVRRWEADPQVLQNVPL